MCDHPINDHPDHWDRDGLAVRQPPSIVPAPWQNGNFLQRIGLDEAVAVPVVQKGSLAWKA
jgi:hypothetical protein